MEPTYIQHSFVSVSLLCSLSIPVRSIHIVWLDVAFGSEALASHFQQVADILKNISLHIAHLTTFQRKTGKQTNVLIILKGMHTRKRSLPGPLDSPVHLFVQGTHFRCEMQRPPDGSFKGLRGSLFQISQQSVSSYVTAENTFSQILTPSASVMVPQSWQSYND